MRLACTCWNGPVYWFGRTDTLSGVSEGRLVRGEVGEGRDQFGRVAAPRVVNADVGALDQFKVRGIETAKTTFVLELEYML